MGIMGVLGGLGVLGRLGERGKSVGFGDFAVADDIEAGGEGGKGFIAGYSLAQKLTGQGVDVDRAVIVGGRVGGNPLNAARRGGVEDPGAERLDGGGSVVGECFYAVGIAVGGEHAD